MQGAGQSGGTPSATAWSAPSTMSQLGGRGNSLPGRSRITGSSSIPSIALPGRAATRCHHIGSSPTTAPASMYQNIARCRQIANPSARPSATARSGRNPSASPASPPANHQSRTRSPPTHARTANTSDQSPIATAPCHASADNPIGVMISTVATSAAPVAATWPAARDSV